MEILKFFWTIFYINLFTIGGGYVMLPLLQRGSLVGVESGAATAKSDSIRSPVSS